MDKDKEKEIKLVFYECEKQMRKIMDFLTEHQKEIPNYKGWVWLQGRLIYQPEILFIGYNPAQSKDWNSDFQLPFTGERQLAFFEDNNAYWDRDKLEDTHWWEINKRKSNSFSWQTLDILDKIAVDVYDEAKMDGISIPRWGRNPKNENTLGGKITFINLYPIATKDSLTSFNAVASFLEDNNFFEKGRKKTEEHWPCKLDFVKRMKRLIKVMEPKLIVCMGAAAYHDFTGDGTSTKPNKSIYYNPNNPEYRNVIGFDRSGTWNTEEIATGISNLLKELGPSKCLISDVK